MPRFFRHGELHLVLLSLLVERPMHGYELMGEIDIRFGPRYRASSGSVYPALQALAGEGLIEEDPSSEPTSYRLTPSGEQALAKRLPVLARLEERTGASLGSVVPLEEALRRLTIAAREAGLTDARKDATALLEETTERLIELNGNRRGANHA